MAARRAMPNRHRYTHDAICPLATRMPAESAVTPLRFVSPPLDAFTPSACAASMPPLPHAATRRHHASTKAPADMRRQRKMINMPHAALLLRVRHAMLLLPVPLSGDTARHARCRRAVAFTLPAPLLRRDSRAILLISIDFIDTPIHSHYAYEQREGKYAYKKMLLLLRCC